MHLDPRAHSIYLSPVGETLLYLSHSCYCRCSQAIYDHFFFLQIYHYRHKGIVMCCVHVSFRFNFTRSNPKKAKVHEILHLLGVRSIEIPTLEQPNGDRRRLKDVAVVFTYSTRTFEVLIWGGRLPHEIYITIIKFFSLFYCVTCH